GRRRNGPRRNRRIALGMEDARIRQGALSARWEPVGESRLARGEGSSCEAAPESRARGVLPVRSTRRGASPPFRNLPPGLVAPAKPALEHGALPRGLASNASDRLRHSVG